MNVKLCRSRPIIRRAQTTDLRSLGVKSTVDSGTLTQKPRATSDDEDVPSARVGVTGAVATWNSRSVSGSQFNGEASHVLLLILRKSLIVLIVNFFPRLPTLVIVYPIYSLIKPLHTVLTVSEKDNIITSS